MIELTPAVVGGALLWVLGAGAALVAAVCLAPFHLKVRVDALEVREEHPGAWDAAVYSARFSAALGALSVSVERRDGGMRGTFRLLGFSRPLAWGGSGKGSEPAREAVRRPHKRRPRPERRPRTRRARGSGISWREMLGLLPEAKWLFAQARRLASLEMSGALVYGFPDPFTTAMAHLFLAALPPPPGLDVRPDFAEGRLEGWLDLEVRIVPLMALYLLLRLGLRPRVRALWWSRLRHAVRSIPKRKREALTA